jgi:hypothetical protein
MLALVGLWQPLVGEVYRVEQALLRGVLLALGGSGWVHLLAATFAIDHFQLFGVKQGSRRSSVGVWTNRRSRND